MKQNPSNLKFKKNHKISKFSLNLVEDKNFYVSKGLYALKAYEKGKLTYNQIESCRKSLRRMLGKQDLILLRVFTNISVTKKPIASRMGKGKGNHNM